MQTGGHPYIHCLVRQSEITSHLTVERMKFLKGSDRCCDGEGISSRGVTLAALASAVTTRPRPLPTGPLIERAESSAPCLPIAFLSHSDEIGICVGLAASLLDAALLRSYLTGAIDLNCNCHSSCAP